MKLYYTLSLLICFCFPFALSAQTWKPLGPDETETSSEGSTLYSCIITGPDGTPYIAYSDDVFDGRITVKKYNGSKWIIVGKPGLTEESSSQFDLKFSPDGELYLIYGISISQQRINVKKLVGDTWVNVGTSSSTGFFPTFSFASDGSLYQAYTSSLTDISVKKFTSEWGPIGIPSDTVTSRGARPGKLVVAADGTPYLAYTIAGNQNKLSVKKFSSGKWQFVGNSVLTGAKISVVDMTIADDGTIYVSYLNGSDGNKVYVQQFKNGTWSIPGGTAASLGASSYCSIFLAKDNTPYIIFNDNGNGKKIFVKHLVNNSWNIVGNSIPRAYTYNSAHITIDKNGTSYIAYRDSALNSKVVVKKLTGNQWTNLGMGGVSPELASHPTLKVSNSGDVYAAFIDDTQGGKLSVRKYQSGEWQLVGPSAISQTAAQYPDMDIGPDGTPYIVYKDSTQNSYAIVKKFSGGNWIQVGDAVSSGAGVAYMKIALSNDGIPYVIYSDYSQSSRFTVKKYANGTWISVGNLLLPVYVSIDVNLIFDKNNNLYIGYADGITYKANVIRFDGTSWNIVGNANFSTNIPQDINLALAQDGSPYFAYRDKTTNKIAVQGLINNTWTAIGGVTASDSSASVPKLIFDASGQLYVGYIQWGVIRSHAIVRKLVQEHWVDAGNQNITPWSEDISWMALALMPNGDMIHAYLDRELFVRIKTSDNLPASPVIKSCSPSYGGTGTIVTINGYNLSNVTSVKFGKTEALSFTTVSPNVIQATVGEGSSGLISITTPYGTGTFDSYIFSAAPPAIKSFSPKYGSVNSTVTIYGKHFDSSIANNTVYFGGALAQVLTANDSTLTVKVPVNATYSPISVTTRQLTAYSTLPFNITFKGKATFDASSFSVKKDIAATDYPDALLVADLDKDGKNDIIATSYYRNQAIFQNLSNSNSISLTPIANAPTGGKVVEISDLDGDGKLDLTYSGTLIYKNISTPGNIGIGNQEYYTPNPSSFVVTSSDVDMDGRPDIISGSSQSSDIVVYRNSSSTPNCVYFDDQLNFTSGGFAESIKTADLDGDGKPEIISLSPDFDKFDGSAAVYILKNNSTAHRVSFIQVAKLSVEKSSTIGAFAIADIDGDGKLDILVPNSTSNTVSVLRNQTNGTIAFAPAMSISSGQKPQAVAVADLDGDNKPDMAVVNLTDNTVSVYKNTSVSGSISFAAKINYSTGASPQSVVAADLDGDGIPELITGNYTANTISVLRNNMLAAAAATITFPTLSAATYGNADIVLAATSTDIVDPITYTSSDSTIARINGNKIHILKVGNVVITAAQKNGNISPVSQAFVILPAKLIVTANNATKLSGSENPTLTLNYTGFVNGDDVKSFTLLPVVQTTATASSAAGDYAISVSGGQIPNYTLFYVSGTLTVEFTLPATNFEIKSFSTTCKGNNDGSLTINASQSLNYTATVTGNAVSASYPFTSSTTINNLAAGTYNVCITVQGQTGFQQCYSIVIKEPQDLSVYSTVNDLTKTITLALTGGTQYNIQLNDVSYSTRENSLTLSLSEGNNMLTVTTDKLCQGVIQKLISISGKINPYPVPFQNTLYLNLGNTVASNVSVEIYNVSDGKRVFSKQFGSKVGVLQLDVTNLSSSVYSLHLIMDNSEKVFKVIKK